MSFVSRTEVGNYRANWRDPAGRQRAKTFPTKREANAFLAEIGAAINRGTYVDPGAGKTKFGPYAERWLAARNVERTTADRDSGLMRNHVLPYWRQAPLAKIDYLAVQEWVGNLASRRAPATVAECFRLMSNVMRSAIRDRLIGHNPCEGVRLPKRRKLDIGGQVLTQTELAQLLPFIPDRYRALISLAAGTGLRWGECLGLRWECVDVTEQLVYVVRVATEVNGHVVSKPFPKTKAGRRTVPLPTFAADALVAHHSQYPAGPAGEVFTNSAGGPLRRSMFRTRVWRPALVRSGLLGKVVCIGPDKWTATWPDRDGVTWTKEFTTERDAIRHIVRYAAGGLRFHDIRHSYATWLVSAGLPVNDVQRVMGHERASTTLDRYTHSSRGWDLRVRNSIEQFVKPPSDR